MRTSRTTWRDERRRAPRARALTLALVLSGCAESGASSSEDAPEPALPSSAWHPPSASPTRSERLPGPDRARGHAALVENAKCVECHEQEAAEWRGSRHRLAFENRAFQEALAVEPALSASFCRGCHAPEADPTKPPSAELAALGVACVTCHVTEPGAVVAPGHVAEQVPADDEMPHTVLRSPAFGHTGACASCHEFRFPFAPGDGDEAFMQTTLREHARSAAGDRSCASCHMPKRPGGRSHAFDVREPTWLRAALDLSVEGTERGSVIVSVAQKEPAHAFPTGDLFRRVEVGAVLRSPNGQELARTRQYLARHLVLQPGRAGRVLERDDRVFDDAARVELTLVPAKAPPRGAMVSYWVSFQRVAQAFDGHDPSRAEIESEVLLLAGTCRVKPGAVGAPGFALTSCQGNLRHEPD